MCRKHQNQRSLSPSLVHDAQTWLMATFDRGGWAASRTGSLHDLYSEFPILISFGLKSLGSKIWIATWSVTSKDIALRDVTPRR